MSKTTLDIQLTLHLLERGRDESGTIQASLRLYPNKDKSFEKRDTHFATIQIYRNR